MSKEKLAVIGTGMAGMSAAYFLQDQYDITVFEKNNYVGGHTNTITVSSPEETVDFDTGFMVFNKETYPNMIKLFKKLEVPYKDTSMSFSVAHRKRNIEFSGTGLNGLFGQRKNLLKPSFYKLLLEIDRFNKTATDFLNNNNSHDLTIDEYLTQHRFSKEMKDLYLVPMSSAVWSTPHETMNKFPAKTLIRFFDNHGFLGLDTQHQWKTVIGGSKNYRDRLIKNFQDKIKTNSPVVTVSIDNDKKVKVITNSNEFKFDKVILASHADESLRMRNNPTELELKLLSAFRYQDNLATVHFDESVMPKNKNLWSSWNYITPNKNNESYTVYWMNSLQHISNIKNYFININGEKFVDPKKIHRQIAYSHPLFNIETEKAQPHLHELNKNDTPVYYAGAYFRYGFHEDALWSGINVAESILGREITL